MFEYTQSCDQLTQTCNYNEILSVSTYMNNSNVNTVTTKLHVILIVSSFVKTIN